MKVYKKMINPMITIYWKGKYIWKIYIYIFLFERNYDSIKLNKLGNLKLLTKIFNFLILTIQNDLLIIIIIFHYHHS